MSSLKDPISVSSQNTPLSLQSSKKSRKTLNSGNSNSKRKSSLNTGNKKSSKTISPSLKADQNFTNSANLVEILAENDNVLVLPKKTENNTKEIPLTKSLFMDGYSQNNWSLSNIPCPSAFKDTDMMVPPIAFNERKRLKYALKFKNDPIWINKLKEINRIALKAVKHYQMTGCSISIITEKKQIIKHKINLNLSECSRFISLDAHTILSKDFLVIQDCKIDWRTNGNPLIKGYPFVRFYAGVPLKLETKNEGIVTVGCLSIFDEMPHDNINEESIKYLLNLANKLMALFDKNNEQKEKINKKKLNSSEGDQHRAQQKKIELQNIIGRATSSNNNFNLIFEKDGSGTSYTPNHHLFINCNILKEKQSQINGSTEIRKLLENVTNSKKAALKFSKFILKKYGFDYVAIIELRTTQKFGIGSKYCPKKNKFKLEDFKHIDKLVCMGKRTLKSRILGGYGSDIENISLQYNKFLYESTESEFGLIYNKDFEDDKDDFLFNNAMFMPFARLDSELERKISITSANFETNEILKDLPSLSLSSSSSPYSSNKKDIKSLGSGNYSNSKSPTSELKQVDLMCFSGCFLISCFSLNKNKVNDVKTDLINDIFADTCIYKSMYSFQ